MVPSSLYHSLLDHVLFYPADDLSSNDTPYKPLGLLKILPRLDAFGAFDIVSWYIRSIGWVLIASSLRVLLGDPSSAMSTLLEFFLSGGLAALSSGFELCKQTFELCILLLGVRKVSSE